MRTSMDVQELWLYASDCCLQEVLFDSGDSFSRCPQCSRLCEWEMVDVTTDALNAMNAASRKAHEMMLKSQWPGMELRHSL